MITSGGVPDSDRARDVRTVTAMPAWSPTVTSKPRPRWPHVKAAV